MSADTDGYGGRGEPEPELGLTDADRRRAAALAAKNGTVTADECSEWRRRINDDDATAREIASAPEVAWTIHTINEHASGRCSHDVAVPTVGPADPHSAAPLSRAECVAIHHLDERGLSNSEIAFEVDRSVGSVRRHLSGKCGHEHPAGGAEA